MAKIRLILALLTARLLTFLIRFFGKGKGSSLPGRVALKIYPGLIRECKSRIKLGVIMVTGTNGKTTTNNMIARVLEGSGFSVLVNREGANLVTGIATVFANGTDILGRDRIDYACLEVDEAAFPHVASQVNPQYVVVTNFFRDQLDRYGELDKTVSLVRNAIKEMTSVKLILNADDPLVAQLGRGNSLEAVFYGVAEQKDIIRYGSASREAKFCPFCGQELVYSYYLYSQLGCYVCPGCNFSRPDPDVEGVSLQIAPNDTSCKVKFRQGSAVPLKISVYGIYNLYNALAAYTTTLLLDIDRYRAAELLLTYQPATGRMERFHYQSKTVYLNLVKNPTGFNEALEALVNMAKGQVDVLIAINDNDADGKDISWLWDVDFEILEDQQEKFRQFVCSGQRAEEMALRLKYAGISQSKIIVQRDFKKAVGKVLEGQGLMSYIMATYTALWPVERILSGCAERDQTQTEYLPHVS